MSVKHRILNEFDIDIKSRWNSLFYFMDMIQTQGVRDIFSSANIIKKLSRILLSLFHIQGFEYRHESQQKRRDRQGIWGKIYFQGGYQC